MLDIEPAVSVSVHRALRDYCTEAEREQRAEGVEAPQKGQALTGGGRAVLEGVLAHAAHAGVGGGEQQLLDAGHLAAGH